MPGIRIMAIAALVLIGVLYLATLVLSFIDSPLARSFLMAALFCTIVVPAMLYGYLLFTERFGSKGHSPKDSHEKDIQGEP